MSQSYGYWLRKSRTAAISRRRFVGGAAIAGAGMATLGIVGCGDDDDEQSGGTPTPGGEDEAPQRGGTLRTGTFLDVLGIDPHIEVSIGLTTAAQMYTYLGAFNTRDNEFVPLLADSHEQASDLEFVFTLNKGFKHQNLPPVNGREVTADDVLYSLERFRDLPEAQNNSFYKAIVDKMQVIDDHTFKVTTKLPYAESLIELGGIQSAIVPHEAVEQFGNLSSRGVGAGPYILENYVKGERERLIRNPDYFHSDLPYLDASERITILDMSTLLQAYKNDQLDLNGALMNKLDYDGLPSNRVNYTLPALHYGSLGLNASVKPYSDPRVRQAIYLAVDRKQFVDKLGFGDGFPMGPLSAGLEYWALSEDDLAPYIGPDYNKAKELLSAAGYPNGFTMDVETSGGVQLYIDHANIMVSELNKVGIKAELKLSELGDYLSNKLFAGNFNATVFTHNPYETPKIPLGMYHKMGLGGGSWWHYENEAVSKKIDEQANEMDGERRRDLVKEAQRLILDDYAPMMNFYSPMGYGSHHPRLGGYDPTYRGFQLRRYTEFIKNA